MTADEALAGLGGATLEVLEWLRRAARDPDAQAEHVARNALDLLLRAAVAAAGRGPGGDAVRAALVAWEEEARDVNLDLAALAAGWSCPRCGSARPARARARRVRSGRPEFAFECATCRSEGPPPPAAREVLERRYGVRAPLWNPRCAGFDWDGT